MHSFVAFTEVFVHIEEVGLVKFNRSCIASRNRLGMSCLLASKCYDYFSPINVLIGVHADDVINPVNVRLETKLQADYYH